MPIAAIAPGMNAHGFNIPTKITMPKTTDKH
jgi:hypothetical protein